MIKMNILLAEDDRILGTLIVQMLEKEFYSVDWVYNGADAYHVASTFNYDLLILDWMMPEEDGVNVCSRLRKDGFQGGIMMLTARDSLEDLVQGLDAGADDYLVKPIESMELLARIRALLRRSQTPIQENNIRAADFVLDCTSHSIFCHGSEIRLTPREFQLMELLIRNYGKVVPKEIIIDRIWGYEATVTINTLEAFVRLLRKKLECSQHQQLIHTIRGVGYKLEVI